MTTPIDLGAAGVSTLRSTDSSGVEREYLISVPGGTIRSIAVRFHPFGSRPELVVHGEGPGDYLVSTLDGAGPVTSSLGTLIVAPRSRGRALSGVSLAWPAHLDAAVALARHLGERADTSRIVTGGLSMGGLEALVAAGRHPAVVHAAWAVNPIVDLAAWHDDLAARRTGPSMWDSNTDGLIEAEVGAPPAEAPESYDERSPLSSVAGLATTRVRLTWSPMDSVIPFQATQHAHRLAEALRAAGGDVTETITAHHAIDASIDAGRFAHESCDVRENVAWAEHASKTR